MAMPYGDILRPICMQDETQPLNTKFNFNFNPILKHTCPLRTRQK